jgi:hypothetical protein
MKKALVERNIVVVLFILVIVVFSFADRDSKKLDRLYTLHISKPAHSLALLLSTQEKEVLPQN